MRRLPILFVPVLLVVLAGCGDKTPTAPTDSTPPVEKAEAFSGTLNRNGAQTFPFAVERTGNITTTLTSLSGVDVTRIGLMVGTWNGSSCYVPGNAKDDAVAGTSITNTATTAGQFCVRVYDTGGIPDGSQASFVVNVTHY